MITAIAGGVGAARFLQGLLAVHSPSQVTIVSNVGDDSEFFGLYVSPDIDAVLYHLSGLADEEQGFGLTGDTYAVLEALPRYGYDTWFKLGDRDLAKVAARLAADETMHFTVLNSALGRPVPAGALSFGA